MRFGHVELFVRDVVAARAFWEGVLGFEVTDVQHGGRIVWMRLGDAQVLLRPAVAAAVRDGAARYGTSGPAIVLYTDDHAGTLERLRAGGLVVEGDDGPGCPVFRDPDGHWIQLVDPRHA
ncbi:MAG: VOC family protein [Planctomycetes bacterium]|nr:VOC family protein [Planctomycetota bacterium]